MYDGAFVFMVNIYGGLRSWVSLNASTLHLVYAHLSKHGTFISTSHLHNDIHTLMPEHKTNGLTKAGDHR